MVEVHSTYFMLFPGISDPERLVKILFLSKGSIPSGCFCQLLEYDMLTTTTSTTTTTNILWQKLSFFFGFWNFWIYQFLVGPFSCSFESLHTLAFDWISSCHSWEAFSLGPLAWVLLTAWKLEVPSKNLNPLIVIFFRTCMILFCLN